MSLPITKLKYGASYYYSFRRNGESTPFLEQYYCLYNGFIGS